MAFTIRKLSNRANKQLEKLLKSGLITTKSKAIEYVLQEHFLITLNDEQVTKWRWKYQQSENELTELKQALKTVLKSIQ